MNTIIKLPNPLPIIKEICNDRYIYEDKNFFISYFISYRFHKLMLMDMIIKFNKNNIILQLFDKVIYRKKIYPINIDEFIYELHSDNIKKLIIKNKSLTNKNNKWILN